MEWTLLPIVKITPSGANSLNKCALRYLCDTQNRTKRPSIAAILGTAGHAVLEWAGKLSGKDAVSFRNLSEEVWINAIRTELKKTEASPFYPQLKDYSKWPGYALKKSRVLRLAATILPTGLNTNYLGMVGKQKALVEKFLENDLFRGKLDRVEFRDTGTTLIDWKSSVDLENIEKQQTYELQLLIYASLLRTANIPVNSAELVAFDGKRHSIRIEDSAIDILEDKFRVLINDTNEKISDGKLFSLAQPGSVCDFCDHKVECLKYWETPLPASKKSDEMRGILQGISQNISGTFVAMTILIDEKLVEILGVAPNLITEDIKLSVGKEIRLDGLRPFGDTGDKFFATMRTHVAVLFGYGK